GNRRGRCDPDREVLARWKVGPGRDVAKRDCALRLTADMVCDIDVAPGDRATGLEIELVGRHVGEVDVAAGFEIHGPACRQIAEDGDSAVAALRRDGDVTEV